MSFNNAAFEIAAGLPDQLIPSDIPEIVFSGRSNVGKSSLINKLTSRKNLARISSQPGKTATINFYRLKNFRLVDLPGYGFAKVSNAEKARWGKLCDGYLSSGRNIKLIIQLIDMRHPPLESDLSMINYLMEYKLPFIVVLTKSDKLKPMERKARLEKLPSELSMLGTDTPIIPFSAIKGEGADTVRDLILKAVNDNSSEE